MLVSGKIELAHHPSPDLVPEPLGTSSTRIKINTWNCKPRFSPYLCRHCHTPASGSRCGHQQNCHCGKQAKRVLKILVEFFNPRTQGWSKKKCEISLKGASTGPSKARYLLDSLDSIHSKILEGGVPIRMAIKYWRIVHPLGWLCSKNIMYK